MAFIYAMSDMHGDMDAYQRALSAIDLDDPANMLVLCGDYLYGPHTDLVMIEAIMRLQAQHPEQVIVLAGNHELMYMIDHERVPAREDEVLDWMRELPFFYETDSQIFVHAGVDEEAGEYWKWGSEDAFYCEKHPWSIGPFLKDVIAGHTGTHAISGDPEYHDVLWDGASHYYIDGSVHVTHVVPILKYDVARKSYTGIRVDPNGEVEEYELEVPESLSEESYSWSDS